VGEGRAGPQLSRRERQVVKLVSEGLTNREIALRLVVSERTAEYHVEQIRNKLGIHSRREVATWFLESERAASAAGTDSSKTPQHPPTMYARSRGVNIAFQVFGAGPFDLVLVPGWVSHLEHMWRHPLYSAYLQRLARFARLILFDKRGTGLSDRVSVGSLAERIDDIGAVMDALGIRRAAVYGVSEGGPLALLFAATHPDRVSALVVYGSFARRTVAPDYPIGVSMEAWAQQTEFTERNWPVIDLERWAPSVAQDDGFREWLGEVRRYGASPGAARELMEVIGEIDVRSVLPAISVPTLVLHRAADATIASAMGRVIAEGIPGATFVELPGADHLPWTGDTDTLVGEIEQFLTGHRPADGVDRVLLTILACDLVISERVSSRLGPTGLETTQSEFAKTVATEGSRFGGQLALASGNRFLLSFKGPARAVDCAHALAHDASVAGVGVRAGIHTGECKMSSGALTGMPIEIARHVADRALAGEVLVSNAVRDLMAGSGVVFSGHGKLPAGDPLAEWQLHAATPRRSPHGEVATRAQR
jgi:pimeloyl-ACP methyl ester carboxylesterase/DNA-binding CsgD family transcriptional regulator